jgi:hypothetical protein
MKRLAAGAALAAAIALCVASAAASGDEPKPDAGMAGKISITGAHGQHKGGTNYLSECSVTSSAPNTQLDCDDPFPNNEPDITVDPTNPNHMIASSNDYGSCCDQWYTTMDGGHTWQAGNMSIEDASRTGSDPVTIFDRKHKVALHSSLNYVVNDAGEACDGDVVVSPSKDGGITWEKPAVVYGGKGCDSSKEQIFNDKEWITADNDPLSKHYGRVYLTWTRYLSKSGNTLESPIYAAYSDDGGKKWSKAKEISGSSQTLCTYQADGPAGQCDENQFSVPTVGPGGTVYVAFQNDQNQALWEPGEQFDDQYLVVKSTDGGVHWSAPTFVVGLEDGSRDYPINVDGRQTLSGNQVRVDSAGNIVADPSSGKLYLVFADNRAGVHDSDNPVTNVNVYLMTSTNAGQSWTGPTLVDPSSSDQSFPWVDVNPTNGTVGVLYNDRSTTNPDLYNAALSERAAGASTFTKTIVSTAPSNPVDSLFFQARDPSCPACAVFYGDYIKLAYGSDGKANMAWTDMRQFVSDPDFGDGFAQFIDFGRK